MDAGLEEWSVNDVGQTEDRIVSRWREVSADEKSHLRNQFDAILRPLGLQTRLVVVERANSIALFFFCLTLSALLSLRDQWSRQRLRKTIQSLFTFLSGASHEVSVKRLAWPATDYKRCLDFLGSVQSK